MVLNDPIGDLIARITNAQMRKKSKVSTPGSRLRVSVLDVLKSEGYIRGYSSVEHKDGRKELEKALGSKIETTYLENVPEGAKSEQTFEKLARDGYGLIFAKGLTLIVTPCALLARENVAAWWRRAMSRWRRPQGTQPAAAMGSSTFDAEIREAAE